MIVHRVTDSGDFEVPSNTTSSPVERVIVLARTAGPSDAAVLLPESPVVGDKFTVKCRDSVLTFQVDENNQPVLDENGNPIVEGGTVIQVRAKNLAKQLDGVNTDVLPMPLLVKTYVYDGTEYVVTDQSIM